MRRIDNNLQCPLGPTYSFSKRLLKIAKVLKKDTSDFSKFANLSSEK